MTVSADVTLLDELLWIFRINPENTIVFFIQYNCCKKIWQKSGEDPADPELIQICGEELMKIFGEKIQTSAPHYTCSTIDYFLCELDETDIIGFWDRDLRIEVTHFILVDFKPNHNEIQYYGEDHGVLLAFETFKYQGEKTEIILDAIRWYANHIGNPGMEISKEYPGLKR